MSKPIRILHVLHGLGTGGAEAIVMNWYRHINRNKVQFDFLIRSDVNVYAEEVSQLGGKVFVMPPYPKCYFANKKATMRFFEEHAKEYAGIHVHGNALLYVNIFDIAKKHGINLRIYHSHSTSTKKVFLLFHLLNRKRIGKMATNFFACSKAAGKWAFAAQPYKIVKNGIMPDVFTYREDVRAKMRQTLGITDETVYGHVGRFTAVKNHSFLLEVFEKILQKDENAVLLLLGDGELFETVKKTAEQKSLSDKIRFMGMQRNIADFMNAMDVFMLPSYNEGLPIVAVEAQAAGLPSVLADRITQEVAITDLVHFLPLSDPEEWAAYALKARRISRKNTKEEIIRFGYDIKQSARYLEDFYCSKVEMR